MRGLGLLLSALALPVLASATEAPASSTGVTRTDALNLPVEELAHRVMGDLGAIIREVTRPVTLSVFLRIDPVLSSLTFATKPQSLDVAGLCQAQTIYISFDYPPREERTATPEETLARPDKIDINRVYKVVGDAESPYEHNAQRRLDLQRKCEDAGRVIPAETYARTEKAYFSLKNGPRYSGAADDQAWMAVIVLQRALGTAKGGKGPAPACAPISIRDRENPCKDVRAVLTSLAMDGITEIEVKPCTGSALTCVTGKFLTATPQPGSGHWSVAVEADIPNASSGQWDVKALRKITVSDAGFAIE